MDLKAWSKGIPWHAVKTTEKGFSQNWPKWGYKETDNWLIHEIAHLIECEDKDIFDPHWGMGPINEDTFDKISNLKQLKAELRVAVIQQGIHANILGRACTSEELYYLEGFRLTAALHNRLAESWSTKVDIEATFRIACIQFTEVGLINEHRAKLRYVKDWYEYYEQSDQWKTYELP